MQQVQPQKTHWWQAMQTDGNCTFANWLSVRGRKTRYMGPFPPIAICHCQFFLMFCASVGFLPWLEWSRRSASLSTWKDPHGHSGLSWEILVWLMSKEHLDPYLRNLPNNSTKCHSPHWISGVRVEIMWFALGSWASQSLLISESRFRQINSEARR